MQIFLIVFRYISRTNCQEFWKGEWEVDVIDERQKLGQQIEFTVF